MSLRRVLSRGIQKVSNASSTVTVGRVVLVVVARENQSICVTLFTMWVG